MVLALLIGGAGTASAASTAVGSGGAAASVDRDATRTAIQVLRHGGNAIDAAVAANATLGVTEPYVAGIGGGGFMLIYLAHEHRLVAIDGRETAPAAMQQDVFIDPSTGQPIPFSPQRITSGMAVGVPGTLATWAEALDRYGTQPLRRLLRPAERVARQGFTVDQTFYGQTQQNLARLQAFSSSSSLFLTPDGQAPPVGSVLRNPELAHTYALIGRRGPGAFYDGRVGAAVVNAVHNPPVAASNPLGFPIRPGVMTAQDVARYGAKVRTPTHVSYRGYDVWGMPPPSSGGSTVGEALNILERFDLAREDRALALHQYLEASRLAYADRNRWVGDPAYFDVPLAGLLSQRYADARACLIGAKAQTSPVAPGDPGNPGAGCGSAGSQAASTGDEGPSTNHLTVVDRDGNIVAYTSTIEQIAGSGMAVPGYGFLLNNELTDFDPAPPAGNSPDPNLPAGGKRPRSSIAPTIVTRDGRPLLTVGSPGGATIITTILQLLIDRLDFGMTLPQAIAAPRASQRNLAQTETEADFISQYGSALAPYGQSLTQVDPIGAATGAELFPTGRVQAAAEPVRRGGGDAEVVNP